MIDWKFLILFAGVFGGFFSLSMNHYEQQKTFNNIMHQQDSILKVAARMIDSSNNEAQKWFDSTIVYKRNLESLLNFIAENEQRQK